MDLLGVPKVAELDQRLLVRIGPRREMEPANGF